MTVTPSTPRRRSNFLMSLFLIGYVIMGGLIIEQGRTIENQRMLIKNLFHDSQQLAQVEFQKIAERQQQKK
jgi:hypothetical protein